jgi:hypothetical protein
MMRVNLTRPNGEVIEQLTFSCIDEALLYAENQERRARNLEALVTRLVALMSPAEKMLLVYGPGDCRRGHL